MKASISGLGRMFLSFSKRFRSFTNASQDGQKNMENIISEANSKLLEQKYNHHQ